MFTHCVSLLGGNVCVCECDKGERERERERERENKNAHELGFLSERFYVCVGV